MNKKIFTSAFLFLLVLQTADAVNVTNYISSFMDRFPAIKELFERQRSSSSAVIKEMTNTGIESYSRSASLQVIHNVEPAMYDGFVQYALQTLAPNLEHAKFKLKSEIFDMVPVATHNSWIHYDIMFQGGQNSHITYICILAHNNFDYSYDFVFATFSTQMQLAPNLLVIQESQSYFWGLYNRTTTRVEEVPANLQVNDVNVLINYFNIATFFRFVNMVNIVIPSGPLYQIRNKRAVPVMAIISGITAGFKLWETISSSLSTEITNSVVSTIVSEGFDHYFTDSVAHRIENLEPRYFPEYLEMAPEMYDIPQKYTNKFRQIMRLVRFSRSNQWNKNDMLFDIGERGENLWITLLSNRGTNGRYNFLVVKVTQRFNLAPDILLIQYSKSIAGGIYKSTKYEFENRPRSLELKDIKQLNAFFTVVTFKRFAETFDVACPADPQIG